MPERKIKAGKDAPLNPKAPAAKQAVKAEVKEAKTNLKTGGEGSVRIDVAPDAKTYDPAKHVNHSHLNP